MNTQNSVLECIDLHKYYQQGPQQLSVLNGIDLNVFAGDKIAIVGGSGSGKSTLLNMLGGLDLPDKGSVSICGTKFNDVNETKRGLLRQRHLGFVYQFHHLLGEFTALENVAMPLLIGNTKTDQAITMATDFLRRVGLAERLTHKPSELSGGERQRVAIARALVTNPDCVLLDEPTGNLDKNTADAIHELLLELNQSLSTSLIVVTHDPVLAARMDTIYELIDGQLLRQESTQTSGLSNDV